MPVVPMPNRDPIREQALPGVRVSTQAPAEAFGGGPSAQRLDNAVQNFAEQSYQIKMEEKKKADDVRTIEANAMATKAKNDLLYNPQYGVMTRRGKDAFGVMDEFTPQYKEKLDEIAGTLSNDAQRDMFKRISAQHSADFDGALNQHVSSEARSYAEETAKTGVAAAQDDAVLNYQTPGAIEKNLALQAAIVNNHADANGLSKDQRDYYLMKTKSETHAAVVGRMLDNGDDLKARAYFDEHKSDIGGIVSAHLEKELEAGSITGESQRQADQIMAKHGGSLAQAIAATKDIKDPKVRAATEVRVHMLNGIQETSDREHYEKLSTTASNNIDKGNTWPPLPSTQWESLPLATKSALEAYAAKKAKGDKVETDFPTYYGLKTLGGNPQTRDVFLKKDLTQYVDKIALPELKELTNDQTEARKGNSAKLDGYLTPINAVNEVLKSNGINPTPKTGTKDSVAVANFQQTVNKEAMALEQKLGRPANADEIATIAKKQMVNGIVEKRWYWTDKKKHLFELDPNEKFQDIEVPDADKKAITDELLKRGKPATKDAINSYYLKGLGFGK